MSEWKNVTDTFSEEQRRYNSKYLEIDEVYDDVVEVSVFSAVDEPYEIYFTYDIFFGIVYAEKENVYEIRDEMKRELQAEYEKHKKVTDEFINKFSEKYGVCMPEDIFLNFDLSTFFQQNIAPSLRVEAEGKKRLKMIAMRKKKFDAKKKRNENYEFRIFLYEETRDTNRYL